MATVHSYCIDSDIITVTYHSEPNNPYEEELTLMIEEGKIKLV